MECYHCFHSESNNDLIRPSKSHLKGDLIISNVSLKLISLNSLPCGVPEKSLIFGVLFREGRGGSSLMKETRTINLNGIVFHIDNDAYLALSNYLHDIELRLPSDDRKEVMYQQ